MPKVGRPKEFQVLKAIRLTKNQAKNWNPDKIRTFLENVYSKKISTNRELNKEDLLTEIIINLGKLKNSIPIEKFRVLELETRILKERM